VRPPVQVCGPLGACREASPPLGDRVPVLVTAPGTVASTHPTRWRKAVCSRRVESQLCIHMPPSIAALILRRHKAHFNFAFFKQRKFTK
jgi:hypothetical protein